MQQIISQQYLTRHGSCIGNQNNEETMLLLIMTQILTLPPTHAPQVERISICYLPPMGYLLGDQLQTKYSSLS